MEFSRQEYWNGLPFPPPGDLPWPREQTDISCVSCIAGGFFTHWAILIIRGLTKSPDFQHLGSHPQMTNMSQNSGSVPPYPGHVVSASLVITPYFFYYQPVSGIYNFSGPLEAWGWGPYAKKMMAALKIPLVKTDLHKWPLGEGNLGGRKKCHKESLRHLFSFCSLSSQRCHDCVSLPCFSRTEANFFITSVGSNLT